MDSASHAFTFTPTGTGNQWKTFSLPFTATTSATRLALVGTASGGGAYLGLDEVSVVPAGGVEPVPPLLSIQTHPGDANLVVIAFTSEPGRTYVVETTGDVVAGPWTPVDGSERLGTGGMLSIPLPLAPDAEARFYRLRIGP